MFLLLSSRCFWGKVPNLNQSKAREHCFQAFDWLKCGMLYTKYRTILGSMDALILILHSIFVVVKYS